MKVTTIPVSALPTRGLLYKKFESIDVPQLTFGQIMSYSAELEDAKTEYTKLLVQLKHLMLTIPNGGEILMPDAYPIMAIRSYTSISNNLKKTITINFMCPIHQKIEQTVIDLDSMQFDNVDQSILIIKSFKLNRKPWDFKVPTVKEFYDLAIDLKGVLPRLNPLKYVWLMSVFKVSLDKNERMQVLRAILNATNEDNDISTLEVLYESLAHTFRFVKAKCQNPAANIDYNIYAIDPLLEVERLIKASKDLGMLNSFMFRTDVQAVEELHSSEVQYE